MNVKNQKRIAAKILGVGKNRVRIDPTKLTDVKEAIRMVVIRSLIWSLAITKKPLVGHSRAKAREIAKQKRKGKRKGAGSRKGRKGARLKPKTAWMLKVRTQRNYIKNLKNKNLLASKVYRDLYRRIKSGLFRTVRLINLYIKENNLITAKNETKKKA